MKKNLLLPTVLILAFATSCISRETGKSSLEGTVAGISSGTVYLQKYHNKAYFVIDSATIEEGTFRFATALELPEIYGLSLDTTRGSFLLFLDENPATVHLDSARNYRNTTVEGSALHDLFVAYKSKRNVPIDSLIREHPASLVSAYALYRDYSYRLSPEEIRNNLALFDPSLRETHYVEVLEDLAATLDKVHVGKQAPDFLLNDPDGNPVQFSDHLGKEQYLLLDFWASWCGPCRRENPHLVKAYQTYHDKGFDIFAVSLDKNRDSWLAAIEKDSLTWTHVSDLAHWDSAPAKLYGVRGIPANFLIDRDGIIVAKNLRDDELQETLNNLLGDK